MIYPKELDAIKNINKVDYFIIGLPKCGTTSVFEAINLVKPDKALKFHSDSTLRRHITDREVTTKSLIDTRREIKRPFYLITGYREPISRKISQYFQYDLHKNKDIDIIKREIKFFCLDDYSLFEDEDEVNENLLYNNLSEVVGVDMLTLKIDDFVNYNLYITPYTLEDIDYLEAYLQAVINSRLSIKHLRTSDNIPHYKEVKNTLKFTKLELDFIYTSRGCRFFYKDYMIQKFKERYKYA